MFKNIFKNIRPKGKSNVMKAIARISWKIAQTNPGQTYKNLYSADEITFTENVISSAKKFVKKQETNNPNWHVWVHEWQNEK